MSKLSPLWQRILEISYLTKSSHIGSALSSVNIIDDIYSIKRKDDIFLLSNAHANLAQLVVKEKYEEIDALEAYKTQGVHSTRDLKYGILCSGGHLGQVFACGIGFALANPKRDVYVLISDGEWYEGVVQEGLNFIRENNLSNLKLYCNFNGYSALAKTDIDFISEITLKYVPWTQIYYPDPLMYEKLPFLNGLNGHYIKITDEIWQGLNEKGLINA
jgi:transketolase N-terminal domain/subunit